MEKFACAFLQRLCSKKDCTYCALSFYEELVKRRAACLAALMHHFLCQCLQQGALSSARGSQQQGHSSRLDGATHIVKNDIPSLARPNTDEANQRLQGSSIICTAEMIQSASSGAVQAG